MSVAGVSVGAAAVAAAVCADQPSAADRCSMSRIIGRTSCECMRNVLATLRGKAAWTSDERRSSKEFREGCSRFGGLCIDGGTFGP